MAKITKRAELFDLMEGAAGAGPIGVVINRMIDAIAAAGLAVVPKEATGAMIDAYYYANPGKLVRHLEKAIATGNLLKEK